MTTTATEFELSPEVFAACGLPRKSANVPAWKLMSRASKALMLSMLVKEQRNPDENEMEIVGIVDLEYLDQETHSADLIPELEALTDHLSKLDREQMIDIVYLS